MTQVVVGEVQYVFFIADRILPVRIQHDVAMVTGLVAVSDAAPQMVTDEMNSVLRNYRPNTPCDDTNNRTYQSHNYITFTLTRTVFLYHNLVLCTRITQNYVESPENLQQFTLLINNND